LLACAVVLGALIGTASSAHAQDADIDENLQRYWSGDRAMPIIAGDKLYATEGRLELGVFGGVLPNDDFFTYFPIGALISYSFDGIWGLELSGAYVGLSSDAELTDFLEANGAGIRKDVDLGDFQLGRADVVATFSPLYGKWSFQTYKISHFDLFFALGAGVVFVEEPEIPEGEIDPADEPVFQPLPEGLIGTGFRFFLADWASLRIDARWFFYPRFDGTEDDRSARTVGAPAEITLGVTFFTPEL